MVQLQNPDRLNQTIELGTVENVVDENDNEKSEFHRLIHTRCGSWTLNTGQMLQNEGLDKTNTHFVVVHHKNSWDGITHARFNGKLYQTGFFNQDAYMNQTAYDLITLKEVEKNG